MAKATLILDKMPENCFFCPLRGDREWFGPICIPESAGPFVSNKKVDISPGKKSRPKWCPLKELQDNLDKPTGGKKMSSYSIDYSANHIVNTITSATTTDAKWIQTDGKDHPDYGFPFYIPQNEPIVITQEAVFIKPLKLVVLTEDVYNKLKEKDDEDNNTCL